MRCLMTPDFLILSRQVNLLGCGFRFPPASPETESVLAFFALPAWAESWPGIAAADLARLVPQLRSPDRRAIMMAWQRLFAGPGACPAPPWGSVYLDPEQVLRGGSTVALSHFLQREGLHLHTDSPEPPDHLGLMLFQAAVLAEENRQAALTELLDVHLLSWLPLFVRRLSQSESGGFYPALAELTLMTVQNVVAALKKPA